MVLQTMFRYRVYNVLEGTDEGGMIGEVLNVFIIALIVANVTAVVLATDASLYQAYQSLFDWFEVVSVAIFTVEYALRLWTAPCNPRFAGPGGRVRFATSPLALIDLVAIMPFYLPMVLPLDLRILRMLRLVRIFRLFKLYRYSEALRMLERVIKAEKEALVVVGFVLLVLLILTSTVMYFVEHTAQPEAFSSIPMAMWWAVATLTTVGYGDVYPVTPLGKLLGGFIAILGIGMFALPAGILASAFGDEIRGRHEKKRICPHCGRCIDDPPAGDEVLTGSAEEGTAVPGAADTSH
ncbi:voltage-gated potassium channel [Methanofollis sp. W23]|uniref:ion transporter n=1 Tax=Methanofollis sp. W23 TaxID=2817849 RepID=UPI001E14AD20|nr:ion transporter [Methanofollis sp. W23]MBP2145138.1 voltage-gated potassium channel [Methanofollis sp. W23]